MVTTPIWGWFHNAYYMLPATSSTFTSPRTWQFSMSQRIATFPFPSVEDGLLLLDLGVGCWIQRRSSSPRDQSSHRWGSWGHCFLLTYLLLVKKKKHSYLLLQNKNPPLQKLLSERNMEVLAAPFLSCCCPVYEDGNFCKWVLFSLSLHNEIGQQQHFQKGIGQSQELVVFELLPRPKNDFGNWVLF